MAQKVTGYVKLQIPAGKATPAPPVGGVVILCVIVVGVIVWIFDGIASGVVNALLALFGG